MGEVGSKPVTPKTIFRFLFIYLFWGAVLGLHGCARISLVAASRSYSLVAVCGLLTAVASLVAEHRL